MFRDKIVKYRAYPPVHLPDRTWPNRVIDKAPTWCSVDLRDGNQALIQPMTLAEKLEMFNMLVKVGFKEIEVGFPSASEVEYEFTRELIEKNLIPGDVTIQVLTQSRESLIRRTFEALRGVKKAVVHLYNSTSALQREVVFRMGRQEVIDLGVRGARLIREEAAGADADIRYEYSPESFTGTEMDFALEICQAVMDALGADARRPVIINLPATVEMSTPNIYADQIEWFIRNMKNRDHAIISLHAHNDRGSAVAATELAMMAGADRVEGTLFGNGERTGNVDILTLAMNLFSQGIDPKLDFSDINGVIDVYQRCTRLQVHPRHPYAGELVYTAFSGSHQDAINKGMKACEEKPDQCWAVPYLPIDPSDVGRTYESIIRINSQSGKGGIAYIMDKEFGYKLPKEMHPEFGAIIQKALDKSGGEMMADEVYRIFEKEYLLAEPCYKLKGFNVVKRHIDEDRDSSTAEVEAKLRIEGKEVVIRAAGNGPLDAFCAALRNDLGLVFTLQAYEEHALTKGSSSKAVSYIMISDRDNKPFWGAGVDTDIIIASLKALLCAMNRACFARQRQSS